ncbi:response regulator [bacterium]|nr:response regulator [bacterium]
MRIFILDDDKDFARILQLQLKQLFPAVKFTHVETIATARETLAQEAPFDLAIFDQNLPDGLGYELIANPKLEQTTVLAVSSDDAPALPAKTLVAGADHFLAKRQVSLPLFLPLVEALLTRKKLEQELLQGKLMQERMGTIRTLLSTLQHEINNPLGAVLGAAYLIKQNSSTDPATADLGKLIEDSGKRINHVLTQLLDAIELDATNKGPEKMFHVPGDKAWDKQS